MSQAVFDLNLEMPPVTVTRVRVVNVGVQWVARCGVCDQRTRPRPMLSAAMRDAMRHGATHAAHMLRAACTQPVRPIRAVQPVDAVHLSEPHDLPSRLAV